MTCPSDDPVSHTLWLENTHFHQVIHSAVMDSQEICDKVRAHYSAASQGSTVAYGSAIAKSFGYTEEELANTPETSNLGLSCGNPLAIASVSEVCCVPRHSWHHCSIVS